MKIERIYYKVGTRPPEPLIIERDEEDREEVYTGLSKCGPVTDDDNSNWRSEEEGW